MGLPVYLAMTGAEFEAWGGTVQGPAWMACHFSPYGQGITNLPPALPENAMLILNDRIPWSGQDPETVLRQLLALPGECLLLDLQRGKNPEALNLIEKICQGFDRPVGVSESFGRDLSCAVFLPPVPPDTVLADYLRPWQGREIWLELELNRVLWTVTEQGAVAGPLDAVPETGFRDRELCCHYSVSVREDRADFSLWRAREDLDDLLDQAQVLGVTRAVGLWQELGQA